MEKKIKILLYDASIKRHEYNEPIGIEVIKGFLLKNSKPVQVDIKTFMKDGYLDEICTNNYDVIGVSLPYNSLVAIESIYRKIDFDKQFLILGNSLSTFAYKQLLELYPKTICSIGEGEYSFADLIDYIRGEKGFSDIRNIAYIQNGSLILSNREVLLSKDLVPPSREEAYISFIKSNKGTFRIEASRGCSYGKCSFCYIQEKYYSCTRREVDLEIIINQLIEFSKFGLKSPYFTDEDFIGDNFGRIEELSRLIYEHKRIGDISQDMQFYVNIKPTDVVSKKWNEVSNHMLKAGIKNIFLGIESGSNDQLRRYSKGTNVDTNTRCLRILENSEFDVEVGFIFFDTFSTINELKETLEFIENTRLYHKKVYLFDRLRVTLLSKYHEIALKKGVIFKPLHLDTITFDYLFTDKKVQQVWDVYSDWKEKSSRVFYNFQIETRGESSNIEASEFLKTLNYLEYKIMKYIVYYFETAEEEYFLLYRKHMNLYDSILRY